MYQIVTTKTFDKLFKALNKKIQEKAVKKSELFKKNPFNSVLRIEKLYTKKVENPHPIYYIVFKIKKLRKTYMCALNIEKINALIQKGKKKFLKLPKNIKLLTRLFMLIWQKQKSLTVK